MNPKLISFVLLPLLIADLGIYFLNRKKGKSASFYLTRIDPDDSLMRKLIADIAAVIAIISCVGALIILVFREMK